MQAIRRRASESLDDVPQDPRLPSYPPVGPVDRLRDLYGSLSALLGMQAARQQEITARRARLAAVGRKIAGILVAIEDGNYNRSLTERLGVLEREQETLTRELAQTPNEPTLRLHPGLAEVYADKVARLEEALNDPAIKTGAAEILRGLIGRIDLVPPDDGPGLEAHLYGGDLARILAFFEGATGKENLPSSGEPGSQLSVVAGARYQPFRTPVSAFVPIATTGTA